jgi:hypothetical protein
MAKRRISKKKGGKKRTSSSGIRQKQSIVLKIAGLGGLGGSTPQPHYGYNIPFEFFKSATVANRAPLVEEGILNNPVPEKLNPPLRIGSGLMDDLGSTPQPAIPYKKSNDTDDYITWTNSRHDKEKQKLRNKKTLTTTTTVEEEIMAGGIVNPIPKEFAQEYINNYKQPPPEYLAYNPKNKNKVYVPPLSLSPYAPSPYEHFNLSDLPPLESAKEDKLSYELKSPKYKSPNKSVNDIMSDNLNVGF